MVTAEIEQAYSGVNMSELYSALNSFDSKGLKAHVEANDGHFKITLDNQDISLKHKHHFFLSAKEMRE